MEIIKRLDPLSGLRRKLWRLPILLKRIALGPLLGRRFMLLTHTGRVSGLRRLVPQRHGHLVDDHPGGWAHRPRDRHSHRDRAGGAEVMGTYAPRHPAAARRLCKIMGFAVDGSIEDYREVGRHIPFVGFVPMTSA